MSIPDFRLACGRQTVPLVPETAMPLADRYAQDVARERNKRSWYVVAGIAWLVVVPAGLVALAVWLVVEVVS